MLKSDSESSLPRGDPSCGASSRNPQSTGVRKAIKQEAAISWIMVDIEADGPIPGDFSMIEIGAVVVDVAART